MSGSRACVATTKDDVRRLGDSFMKSPEAWQAAADLGMSRHGYYFRGTRRCPGPVTADVTAAVFGFFPLEFVRTHCAAQPDTPPPPEITARYAESCRAWGRRCLAASRPPPG
ncbi:hypothetical protein SMC26_19185 [Actinomadura fulvescens]|uniref:Uncharacterized protein n=1 Tax=Actinomadura fulvescens TaxID=46160 RepID=A0ABP6CX93_9ACTN